jgi:hypothetical protein
MPTLNVKGFPAGLYRRLKLSAKREHRSISQQVVYLLERASAEPPALSILELKGLGKRRWRRIKAEKYIAAERRTWD